VGVGTGIHHAEPGLIVKQLEVLDLKLKAWRQGRVPLVEGNGVTEKRVVSRQVEFHRQVLVARSQTPQLQTSTLAEIVAHLSHKLSVSWSHCRGTAVSTLPAGGLHRQEIVHRLRVCGGVDEIEFLSERFLERSTLPAEPLQVRVPRQIGWLRSTNNETAGRDIHNNVSRLFQEGLGEPIVGVQLVKAQPEGSTVGRQVSQKGTSCGRLLAGSYQGLSQPVVVKDVSKTGEYGYSAHSGRTYQRHQPNQVAVILPDKQPHPLSLRQVLRSRAQKVHIHERVRSDVWPFGENAPPIDERRIDVGQRDNS
jgi:hypothetical protein